MAEEKNKRRGRYWIFLQSLIKVTWIKKYLDKNNRGKRRKFIFDFHLEKFDYGLLYTNNLNKMDTIKTSETSFL